jgi:Lamin Tail Domain/Immunoglobulin domain/Domain of unknown function DUF11
MNLGASASTGTVTLTDSLPSGLTATAISGTGWSTNLGALTCTRSDALAGGSGYPPITITVNVSTNAPSSVTNLATVSGGGDANLANNSASDLTTINSSGSATNIVISQVYGGGGNTSASYQNDFVELFNPLPNAVDLSAWSVQYASSTGNSWSANKINLTGSIQPYHYYLIQMASEAAVGALLPTADAANTSINMSASSGKVALVNSQTALTATNPVGLSGVIDFVGYGSANAFEGAGAAPSPNNNATSLVRKNGGYTDTNNNAGDFTIASPPTPRNSASPANGGITPAITSQPQNTNVIAGSNATFTVTASGTAPLSYQWRFNGTNISNATTNIYILTNVQLTGAGNYSVVVTNGVGATNSGNATLAVYGTAAGTLSSATFTGTEFHLSVTGVPGYSYVIQGSTNLINWIPIQTNASPFIFIETGNYSNRFYRAQYLP